MFTAALLTVAKTQKPPVSYDRWSNKENVVCIYNEILLSHKKRWNTAICNNMGVSSEYQAKQSQTEKVKKHMISLICRI